MEIHAPEGPVHNWREFAVHIAIVTVGILIALSLEGIRESIHNRHLVQEARENFSRELEINSDHMNQEAPAVKHANKELKLLVADLPALAQHPGDLKKRIDAIHNPFYFFHLGSWQSALSTGALGHMNTDEVSLYAIAEEATRVYSNLQSDTMRAENNAIAYVESHPDPSPAELREASERVLLWSRSEQTLAYVVDQFQPEIEAAYRRAKQ
jgi:hypothetical protein